MNFDQWWDIRGSRTIGDAKDYARAGYEAGESNAVSSGADWLENALEDALREQSELDSIDQ